MKKTLSLVSMICILSFLLSGCFLIRRPYNLSPTCYNMSMSVLTTTDQYLDNKITAVIAAGKIQDFCRTLSSLPMEEGTVDTVALSYCEILSIILSNSDEEKEISRSEVLQNRNYLAEILGEKPRK